MTQEEILIKLGLDGSGLDSNLQRAEGSILQFGEHAHNSFLHAERPARAFHHLMGEIGQRVPFIAEAFQAIANPTTGVIALVGAGFALAMEKMKEFNKALDETSASNARAIEINKEGLAELGREQREFQKGLNIDPVTGITRAVGEEKDPTTRLSQARQNRERFAAERNARLEEIKRLRDDERRLTVLPSKIKATEELVSELAKSPAGYREGALLLSLEAAVGITPARTDTKEQSLAFYRNRISAMKAALGGPDRIKDIIARRQQLESEVRERSRAISELQDIIDPLSPHDVLPRGRRSASFNISGPGGTFSGEVGGNAQEIKNYLKQIAESPWVKDGKIQVPNGQ